MPTDNGPGGPRSLSSLRTLIRQEADLVNSQFVTDAELNTYINQSRYRLYDKLIISFGDDYFVSTATITTDGVNTSFALPDGTLYSAAPVFYKGGLVEVVSGSGVQPNQPVTLRRYNLRDKNRFNMPMVTVGSPFWPRYRFLDGNIVFDRLPVSGLGVKLWYAPKLSPLVSDSDVADDWSGWLELVVVDCCIKCRLKEESDISGFAARKAELVAEIDEAKGNRDLGEPNTVAETESIGPFGAPGPFNGNYGGGWF